MKDPVDRQHLRPKLMEHNPSPRKVRPGNSQYRGNIDPDIAHDLQSVQWKENLTIRSRHSPGQKLKLFTDLE